MSQKYTNMLCICINSDALNTTILVYDGVRWIICHKYNILNAVDIVLIIAIDFYC